MTKMYKTKVMPDSEMGVMGKKKVFNNNSYQANADTDISAQGHESRQTAFRNVK